MWSKPTRPNASEHSVVSAFFVAGDNMEQTSGGNSGVARRVSAGP
jgi:hypothetical protein